MRLRSCLIACALFGTLLIQGAHAQIALNQPLSQGFYGLGNQAGPATYIFTLPENTSYLFAGIIVKEGTLSMELQDGSGYSYGTGESVIVENAKPGTYTLTVMGTGKYSVFWDYMPNMAMKQQPACTNRLDQPTMGGYYGLQSDAYSVGQAKTYCLPVGEMSGHKPVSRLTVDSYDLGVAGGGINVDLELISPNGQSWKSENIESDETIDIRSQSYPYANYPHPYVDDGNWVLKVTSVDNNDSSVTGGKVRLWWIYLLA